MEQKPIIEIKNLKKRYRMGVIGGSTLRADIQSFIAKKRGLEDPNAIIGQERLRGSTFMALNGVSFNVMPGEAVGIIGVNGAGKSTLLKLISRITAPSDGEIVLRGKVASMLEVGTGFNPELTGRENVYMNGTILGMKKHEIDKKMEEIIEFSECRDFIDTPVKRYSSGMYVKLAFSVAAHLDSDILIMDEVLAVGDVKFQKKCLNKMSDAANKDGRTVLYVSHNMATIRQLCSRCVVLKEGRVIYDGEVEEAIRIYSDESFNFSMTNVFKTPEESKRPVSQVATLKKLEILDTDSLVYNSSEKVKFRLFYDCYKDSEDEIIHCAVKYAGINTIGTHISEAFNVHKGTDRYVDLELDISTVITGRYSCDLCIGTAEVGRFVVHDQVLSALAFEVEENANQKSLKWLTQWWGLNALEPIKVLQDDNA